MDITEKEKRDYVKKAITEGYSSYFNIAAHEVESIGSDSLDIDYDIARNWKGDE